MSGSAVIEELSNFEASDLKHVEVVEKATLPSVEDIETEKKHLSLIDGVESFEKTKLKPTVTEEKIVLPDAATIESERANKPESAI